ncbi:MAG: membrane protein insertase YidC [Rhodococcus sp. (in: high G+C Gram-positive bacteria)]
MLDIVYYPVSGILWSWHTVFGAALGPDSGTAWALAVVFLVFTVRLVLVKPFVAQIRSQIAMKKLQPQIQALRKKHAGDRARQVAELRTLRAEHGGGALLGCLPLLAQAPVFIGLLHVLRSFDRTGTGFGGLGMSAQDNANTANYFFDATDVQSFLDARLFGAPISAAITSGAGSFSSLGGAVSVGATSMWAVAAVAVPLMLLASVATHFNSRAALARQDQAVQNAPQTAIMNSMMLWVFPVGILVGGPFLPIAVLLYWVSNNIWTYAQQHLVYRRIDTKKIDTKNIDNENIDADDAASVRPRSASAPAPGAKPRRRR